MKKLFLISGSVILTSVLLLAACGDDDKDFVVKNQTVSECKSISPTATIYRRTNGLYGEQEKVVVTASTDGFIKLSHNNAQFACDCEKVEYQVAIDDNKIVVVELPDGGAANCFCPMDASCEIGPLEVGATYQLQLANASGNRIVDVEFVYNGNTAVEATIQ